jgi:hypothetical protein
LLRPYRRITQLGGKDSTSALTSAGSWHRLFFRDVRAAAALKIVEGGGTREPGGRRVGEVRPESRGEHQIMVGGAPREEAARPEQAPTTPRARPTPQWTEPDVPDTSSSYAIYRPESGSRPTEPSRTSGRPEAARRPESAGTPRR